MTIYSVANAGILIEIDEKNYIGVDLLCRDPEELYPDTSDEQADEIAGLIKEGKLKLLFFTHEHGDHCAPDLVKQVMDMVGATEDFHIVSTGDVLKQLIIAGVSKNNLVETAADKGGEEYRLSKTFPMGIPGASVTFLFCRHDGAQYADVKNTAFLFDICGRKIVCAGDAAPVKAFYEAIAEWSKEIDMFLAPFPNMALPRSAKALIETIDVKRAACIHLPMPEKDVSGWIPSAKKTIGGYKERFDGKKLPEVIFQEENGRKCILTDCD